MTIGPFRKDAWTLNVDPEGAFWARSKTPYLTRNLGSALALPAKADVDAALAAGEYHVPPFNLASDRRLSFRNAVEGEFASSVMTCGTDGWMGPAPSAAGYAGRVRSVHNAQPGAHLGRGRDLAG